MGHYNSCMTPAALVWCWQGISEASVVAGTEMLLVFSSVAVIREAGEAPCP